MTGKSISRGDIESGLLLICEERVLKTLRATWSDIHNSLRRYGENAPAHIVHTLNGAEASLGEIIAEIEEDLAGPA